MPPSSSADPHPETPLVGASLEDVIRTRRWESALFTTYVLSLTFFESVLLRALRAQRCQDVWVIVDAEGYQTSLIERRSRGVGLEYHLVPVALPRGVFHPKCAYLASSEGDALVVSSGNLTFGGHGRNLEVADVLDAADEPEAFSDFAGFLDALARREDFLAADTSWLARYADRARRAANTAPRSPRSDRSTRLVHSVATPVLDQFVDAARGRVEGGSLTVLSPFHDPDGRAVGRLTDATRASTLAVGIDPEEQTRSPFPFVAARGWKVPPRAVAPALPAETRRLHAKWIDLARGAECLTLTGSVNATSQALCTTNNIEVGALRWTAANDTRERWIDVEAPVTPLDRESTPAGLGRAELVHATLRADGILVGRLLTLVDPTGTWQGALVRPSGERVELVLSVDSSGRFRVPIEGDRSLAYRGSIQLELELGERRTRGWVHVEEILRSSGDAAVVAAIVRMLGREEVESDELALLDYFSMSASKHLSTFGAPVRTNRTASSVDDDAPEVFIEVDQLAPQAQRDAPGNGTADRHASEAPPLWRLMSLLRARLLRRQREPRGSDADDPDDGDGDRRDDSSVSATTDALERFAAHLRTLARESADRDARRGAFVIWFEVVMHMLLHRLDDAPRARAFAREWFFEACASQLEGEAAGALEQHLYTVAAVLPLVDGRARTETQLVHEHLERWCRGEVPRASATSALIVDSRIGFALDLVPELTSDLLRSSLDAVLSATTQRTWIARALADHVAGRAPQESSPVFRDASSDATRRFLHALRRPPTSRSVIEQLGDQMICAGCRIAFNTAKAQFFASRRFAVCDSCARVTVRVRP